jgi:hypothetical protein
VAGHHIVIKTHYGEKMDFLILSKAQMDEINKACSKQAGKPVKIIEECQKPYLIKIKWTAATGTTPKQNKLISLPPIPLQSEFNIHFFVDTQNNFLIDSTKKDSEYYKAKHAPTTTPGRDRDILLKELKEGVALKDGISFKALKKAGETTGEVRISVDKDTFKKVKQVLIWADDMRASFWHAKRHSGFATGRLNMSAEDGKEEADGHAHVLAFEAQMLISPVDYLASEILKNMDNPIIKDISDWPDQRAAYKRKKDKYQDKYQAAHQEVKTKILEPLDKALERGPSAAKEIAKLEQQKLEASKRLAGILSTRSKYDKEWEELEKLKNNGATTIKKWVAINGEASFSFLGSIASKTKTYGDWDYKVHVGGVWGDYIRLGNDTLLCPHDTFSNFHYGYLSAAAKLSLRTTLALGDWGQFIASGTREKRKDDDTATTAGYNAYAKNTADKTKPEAEKIRTELMNFLRDYIKSLNITKVPVLTAEEREARERQKLLAPQRYLANPAANEDEIWKE